MSNTYNIGDQIKTKIHYINDPRSEVQATIIGISIDKDNDKEDVRYLIEFANLNDEIPSNEGYIKEKDIIKKM